MAKICLICEGSYPYVVGGVSSWVQDLINLNQEHEFSILCIIPNKDFAVKKYELPDNVKEVRNITLNPELDVSGFRMFKNNYLKKDKVKEDLFDLMNFRDASTERAIELLDSLSGKEYGNPMEVVVSKIFWSPLLRHYKENHSSSNYNVFYWTYRNIFLNLIGILQEEIPEADIYHSVATGYAGVIAAMAGYRGKGKVLLTEHGIYPREREEEIVHAQWVDKSFKSIWIDFFYFLSKITYRYSDVIVTLFDYNRDLQIRNGADPSKCLVIPNGIDKDRFGNLDFEKRDEFSVGAILRVVPIKDVKMMIKGFRVALRKLRNTKLYLIGPIDENPEYYEECVQMVKSLEMEDYIEFTGKVNVADYYKFLNLLLLTSISEGQPLSILEGLSAGIPFIATDVGNCREILTGKTDIGEAGIIIPPTSYVDLADSLVKMFQSRERLKEMGETGKEIVKKYYSKEIFIEGYRKIYRELGDKQWQE